jgi:hypothetical protein
MKVLVGDILQSIAQTLINTVNCVERFKGVGSLFLNRKMYS